MGSPDWTPEATKATFHYKVCDCNKIGLKLKLINLKINGDCLAMENWA